jgi:hypothetical protein
MPLVQRAKRGHEAGRARTAHAAMLDQFRDVRDDFHAS